MTLPTAVEAYVEWCTERHGHRPTDDDIGQGRRV
jgi:hypothetical protein